MDQYTESKNTDSGARQPEFKSQLHYLPAADLEQFIQSLYASVSLIGKTEDTFNTNHIGLL